jgi:small-conductance mechanosensitive channel
MIAQLWGKDPLPLYLFVSLVDTIATTLLFMLFMYMLHGSVEWLVRTSPLRQATLVHRGDTDLFTRRAARLIDLAVCGLILLPAVLMIWGVFDSLGEATTGLLTLGFNLGSQRISVGVVILAVGVLYGSFLASGVFQKLLVDVVLVRRHVERGVRLSIARLFHYSILLMGFLLTLSILGFDVTKLTIMLSALGLGIGFGLQGVVNNFVSGLILLFERPVRVGDSIEVGGKWARIKRIGIRATTLDTVDHADLIVPNAELTGNQVTNWTLSNRQVRLTIPVGVAYGSDVPLVIEVLTTCAGGNAMVAKTPGPQVLFRDFGESSLNFELRVWALDAEDRLTVKSELLQEIDRSFREARIEIAFPQQDLHLRSIDDSVNLRPSGAPE